MRDAAFLFWTIFSALAFLQSSSPPASPTDGPLVRLTHDGLDKQRPHWSPDGRHSCLRTTTQGEHESINTSWI